MSKEEDRQKNKIKDKSKVLEKFGTLEDLMFKNKNSIQGSKRKKYFKFKK